MMQVSLYGRLGQDPRPIQTASGKPMCVSSVAAMLPVRGEEVGYWLGLVAFGRVAEDLARLAKGDPVSLTGRCQLNRWTDQAGATREQLQVVVDALHSARLASGNPGKPGRPRSMPPATSSPRSDDQPPLPFDDDLPPF